LKLNAIAYILLFPLFSHVKYSRFLHNSFCMFAPVWTFRQVCMNMQKYNYCW